jgi:hypothetical protein
MHVFADDSDSFGKNGFLCLAGFIASDQGWDNLLNRWVDKLEQHKLEVIHTSDLLSGKGEYRDLGLNYEQRLEILHEFMDIIREEVSTGLACAVNAGEYRHVLQASKKRLQPEEFCFHRILRMSFDYMRDTSSTESLTVWLDDSEKTSSRFLNIWTRIKKNWKGDKSMLASISFGDDRALPQLQAADILANVLVRSNSSGVDPWHGQSPFNRMFIDPQTRAVSRNMKAEFWEHANLHRLRDAITDLAKPAR